jgi:cytochrome P450
VDVSDATRSFVACIPASATREDQVGASTAAVSLSALLSPLLSTDSHGVLDELVRAAREAEVHDTGALLANAVGLLSQTYDATAGLVGNTLLAWRRDQAQQAGHVEVTTEYVLEVARHDAPIQNTRRFASADVRMLGETVRAGQAVLVVLAAANRDPAANVDPDAFLPGRRAAALFTFGLGAHACPGRQLAVVIATAVVRTALEHGVDESSLPGAVRYRPLANARIPEL